MIYFKKLALTKIADVVKSNGHWAHINGHSAYIENRPFGAPYREYKSSKVYGEGREHLSFHELHLAVEHHDIPSTRFVEFLCRYANEMHPISRMYLGNGGLRHLNTAGYKEAMKLQDKIIKITGEENPLIIEYFGFINYEFKEFDSIKESIGNIRYIYYPSSISNAIEIIASGIKLKRDKNNVAAKPIKLYQSMQSALSNDDKSIVFIADVALGNTMSIANEAELEALNPIFIMPSFHRFGGIAFPTHVKNGYHTPYDSLRLDEKKEEFMIYDPRQIKIRAIIYLTEKSEYNGGF